MAYIRVYNAGQLIHQAALNGPKVTIGRSEECGVVLRDAGVSRCHAALIQEPTGWLVEDQGSSNGVFLNKQRVQRHKLKYWDEIQIQQFVIRFLATPGLQSGEAMPTATDEVEDHEATSFVSLKSKQDLERLRQRTQRAYVEYTDAQGVEQSQLVPEGGLSFGRGEEADIRFGGWFAPALACRIEQAGRGYQIVPYGRGRVEMDGQRLHQPTALSRGASFSVRGRWFHFDLRMS